MSSLDMNSQALILLLFLLQITDFDISSNHESCYLQAPAVDVVAVGLADGQIILHNLRYNESVMTFKQDWGPVTNITFRTGQHINISEYVKFVSM